jgi:hypothetical protein
MRKIKAFGCIVLVIASVMVFSLASVPEVASAYTPTPEDLEFIEWVDSTEKEIYNGLSNITEAKTEMFFYGELLSIYRYLKKIGNFSISPELEPLRREYRLELEEAAEVYENTISAIDAYKVGYFSKFERCTEASVEHTQKAFSHREKVRKYLERAREGKALPGFEVIFAIANLLTVAYLVLRRRR